MKFNDTLLTVVRKSLETNQVPALFGEPGIGKSSFVEKLARDMDTRAFVLACNQLADKADLTGARLVPTEDGSSYKQEFFPHAVVQEAIEYARTNPREWPILFFDEVNRTTPDVTSAVLTMITLRQLGREKLPNNLRIMIAGNDKGNVTTLDDASLSRFVIFRVEPEAATLIALLGDELNPWVKAVLTEHPHLVFQKAKPAALAAGDDDDDDDGTTTAAFADLLDTGEEMRQLTTPRTIDGVSRFLNNTDISELQEWLATPASIGDRQVTVLHEVLEGFLGDTDFTTMLVAKIADALASGQTQNISSTQAAPKPNCYAQLKAAGSVSDLEALINQLTEHEKSGSLLYALYEKADNSRLIEQLAMSIPAFEGEHMRQLVLLASQSMLDQDNLETLMRQSGPLADSTRTFMSAFA